MELGDNIEMLCKARGTPTNTQVITPRSDDVEEVMYRGYYRTEDIALMEVCRGGDPESLGLYMGRGILKVWGYIWGGGS